MSCTCSHVKLWLEHEHGQKMNFLQENRFQVLVYKKKPDYCRKTGVTFFLHVRGSSECLKAVSCIDTPNFHSLSLSCVLVGWFETSRPTLWIMKSVKLPLTFTRQDAYKPPSSLCASWDFLLRWKLVVLKMDSRARSCLRHWNSELDCWCVASRPPEDTQTLLQHCRTSEIRFTLGKFASL